MRRGRPGRISRRPTRGRIKGKSRKHRKIKRASGRAFPMKIGFRVS